MAKPIYIRPLFKNDWKSISKIYKEGIETNMATFETSVPKWKKWKRRHLIDNSLVAQLNDEVVGFATLASVSKRNVYRGVAAVSIYISNDHKKKGIGEALLNSLIKLSEDNQFWTLQASIFSNNKASLELHKKCGFRTVGIRENIGNLHGKWYDNTLMERRSQTII